jgi:hypothetical protein
MQNVTAALHVNIGFLFQQADSFANGVVSLEKSDRDLADYVRETRKWSEGLLTVRNAIEHDGWMLPRVTYSQVSGSVKVGEPQVLGKPVTEFAKLILDRLTCFVEEVTAHCLQAQMPNGISITEIPLAERPSEIPERFRLTLAAGGMPVWHIRYHDGLFEEA